MAVSVTALQGPNQTGAPSNDTQAWTVIATADADTVTASTTHNMGVNAIPIITGILTAAQISLWVITTLSATAWIMTKAVTAGSGNAGAQVRLTLKRFQ